MTYGFATEEHADVILPKQVRQQLYSGRPIRIRWPVRAHEPQVDHVYSVQSGAGKRGVVKIRVLEVGETTVLVKLEGDPVRLLGNQMGYTDHEGRAIKATGRREDEIEPEPEAVDPEEIEHYRASRQARERFQTEKVEEAGELLAAMSVLRSAIDTMGRAQKRRIGQSIWRLKARLDEAEREIRRKAAA